MHCNNLVNNIPCGKCKHDVLSNTFPRGRTIYEIARVAANILWTDAFTGTNELLNNIDSIYISCNSNIYCNVKNSKYIVDITEAKYIYTKLINNWYDYYSQYKIYDSYNYVQERLKIVQGYNYITNIRTESLSIAKYMKRTTVCDGICSTITIEKEISHCKIPLSDINKIVKLNSDGLVDVLNTILYTIKDLRMFNLTINLNTTYITCAGNIIMEESYIKCRSALADMKSTYIYYLSAWCSANICKQSEVAKIKNNINKVNNAKYMSDIYDLSCDLLEIL